MKKTFTLLVLIPLSVACFSQTIPNGDFESFTGDEPTGWLTLNQVAQGTPLTTSTTDAHGGNLAVINRPQSVFTQMVYPTLTLGIELTGVAPVALDGDFNSVQGWIKTNLVMESEQAIVSALFYPSATDTANPVGSGSYTTEAATNDWTFFQTQYISAGGTESPTHYTLVTTMSNDSETGGSLDSFFMLDDLSLTSSTTSVFEIEKIEKLFIYPNPAQNKVHLHLQQNDLENATFRLIDATGKIAKNIAPNSGYFGAKNYIDISGVSAGLYTLTASTKNGTVAERLIVR